MQVIPQAPSGGAPPLITHVWSGCAGPVVGLSVGGESLRGTNPWLCWDGVLATVLEASVLCAALAVVMCVRGALGDCLCHVTSGHVCCVALTVR
jgi:hypothetical protein